MTILTIKNSSSELHYRLWDMSPPFPRCLIQGKIDGISEEKGSHSYNYIHGSGKGVSRNLTPEEALGKMMEIIEMASRSYFRLENIEIAPKTVGYLVQEKLSVNQKIFIVTNSILNEIETHINKEKGEMGKSISLNVMKYLTSKLADSNHVAICEELMFGEIPEEIKSYPVPEHFSSGGKINRFTHGAIRLKSIIEETRRLLRKLPRRIIVCDIDETTQITAIKGETIIASTHEYGGSSSIFSSNNCGAINPSAILAMASIKKMDLKDVIHELMTGSGASSSKAEYGSIEKLIDNMKLDSIIPHGKMFLNQLITTIAGQVALLGGIELLVISGKIGVESSFIRSLLASKLTILRLTLDEGRNEKPVTESVIISPLDARVMIVVVKPDPDKQMAEEILSFIESSNKQK